jgi:two-component system, cell cycle sensor histidine kinase and response regulator CckA
MQRKPDPLALRVSLVYSLVAGLWILFSDKLLGALAPNPAVQTRLSIYKGWAFVVTTAFLLYTTLARTLRDWRREAAERARAEEELRERTTFLKAQVDCSPDGIMVVDSHGKIILQNQRSIELWKIPPDIAADPNDARQIKFVTARTKNPAQFAEKIAGLYSRPDETSRDEIELVDGTILDRSTAPVKDEAGKYYGRIWTFRDITLRRQAEQVLAEREQQLSLFIQQSPVALAMFDRDMRYLAVSQRWLTDFRLGERNIVGESHYDVFPEIPERWKDIHQRCLAGAVERCEEDAFVRADGLTDWLRWEVRPWRDPRGNIGGIVIFSEDITRRKRTEAALQESQTLYHALVDQLPVGVFRKDAEGRYIFVNPFFCHVENLTEAQYLGKLPRELPGLPAEFTAQSEEHHATIVRTGNPIAGEEIQHRPNGETRHFHFVKSPVQDAAGKVVGSQGIVIDITRRKRTEAALLESQALYYSLVEQLPVGVFRKDAAGRYVFVNSHYCQLQQLPRDAFLGKLPHELPVEEARVAEAEQHHAIIMRTGRPVEVEETHPHPGREDAHFRVIKSPVLNAAGKITGTQGILFDITPIKRAEAERQRLEAHYRILVENTSDIITIIDPQGVIQFESEAVQQHLDYRPEELVGRNVFEYLHPDDIPRARHTLRQAIENRGVSLTVECRFRHRNGSWRDLETVGKTLFTSADGRPDIILSSRDLTEHRKLEEQLRQSQKMEAIGQLAGGVAHDFNNIMAVIQMQLDLLRTGGDLVPDQQESAAEIGKAAQRAAALTRQLLLFSRRETLRPCDLDLNESLTDITKMLQRIVGEDVQMILKLATQSLSVHADAGMIDQVLMNLAVNSRDAMPGGGQLVIETAAVEIDELAAAQSVRSRPGSFVRLSVSDTGTGIPPEVLPRIFDPFFTTKGVGKGTGLGLATVFGIVQQHHGWIDVYSEAGHGTTFRIYLPRLTESSSSHSPLAAPVPAHGGRETILLVEDDPALRGSLRNALTHLGYRVIEAASGVAALEIWRQHREAIDLLFTDLVMPDGMNGYELARQIQLENPGLKVIYASGYCADVASDHIPLKEGYNFLAKPFDACQLARAIRNRLDGKE